jgi:hypothetical protein
MKLLQYDTIIFDLDYTIWEGCRPQFWAKCLVKPYTLINDTVRDVNDDYIVFHPGIKEVLNILSLLNKKLGFASIGGLENTPIDAQPSIEIMKLYEIYQLFTYQKIIVYKTQNKASLIKPYEKTLYIDDDIEILKKVRQEHSLSIDVLNRNSFKDWRDILDVELPLGCI